MDSSCKAFCQWALLNEQITTLPLRSTVQKSINPGTYMKVQTWYKLNEEITTLPFTPTIQKYTNPCISTSRKVHSWYKLDTNWVDIVGNTVKPLFFPSKSQTKEVWNEGWLLVKGSFMKIGKASEKNGLKTGVVCHHCGCNSLQSFTVSPFVPVPAGWLGRWSSHPPMPSAALPSPLCGTGGPDWKTAAPYSAKSKHSLTTFCNTFCSSAFFVVWD